MSETFRNIMKYKAWHDPQDAGDPIESLLGSGRGRRRRLPEAYGRAASAASAQKALGALGAAEKESTGRRRMLGVLKDVVFLGFWFER